MVARGAQGNPWLFAQIKAYLAGNTVPEKPELSEVIAMILRHTDLEIAYKGEAIAIREMRKHVAWYVSGCPGAAKLRNAVNEVETREQLKELLWQYLEGLLK